MLGPIYVYRSRKPVSGRDTAVSEIDLQQQLDIEASSRKCAPVAFRNPLLMWTKRREQRALRGRANQRRDSEKQLTTRRSIRESKVTDCIDSEFANRIGLDLELEGAYIYLGRCAKCKAFMKPLRCEGMGCENYKSVCLERAL